MLEHDTTIRSELVAARVAALHRSAERPPAGALRRAVATGLVRLGLRMGYDGLVPPFVSQGNGVGAGLTPGTHPLVRT
jgi:hypothetical protein